MGLLDGLLGSLMGGAGSEQGQGATNPLLQIAMRMIAARSGSGGGIDVGGLSGIVDAFQKGGLGHITDSWVGTGENLPVNPDQISEVLGSDKIGAIASQLGMSHGDVAGGLAKMLPDLINHVTPNGQIPGNHGTIEDALAIRMKR